MKSKSKSNPQTLLLVLIGAIGTLSVLAMQDRPRRDPLPAEDPSPQPARTEVVRRSGDLPRWFLSDYDRLEVGQSWASIQSTLGSRGELVEQSGAGTTRVRFRNGDGSYMLLTIQNGALAGKEQSGLADPPGP